MLRDRLRPDRMFVRQILGKWKVLGNLSSIFKEMRGFQGEDFELISFED